MLLAEGLGGTIERFSYRREVAVTRTPITLAAAEAASYMILALKSAFITSQTLGNDSGVRLPEVYALTSFCLTGLGASIDDAWLDAVSAQLHLPERITLAPRSSSKRASRTSSKAPASTS